MSGIVGIYDRSQNPVDRSLLCSLTRFLSYCGPDHSAVWSDRSIGFGHTMLRTTFESETERQPASCENRFFITSDARIDCRSELRTKLEHRGRKIEPCAPDSELILQSYAEWGDACTTHLLGDFAFAIWDANHNSLFCARDHFGIKPFYYSEFPDCFLFSNTLNCLRAHPRISGELDDLAIADFLLFGANWNVATTTFRDIRRLPPAHTLRVTANEIRLGRYWTPPVDGCIRYRRADEYIDHFRELLALAVADRLRMNKVAVLLSGGLDSSSLAATAREIAAASGNKPSIHAYTLTYESLNPDPEKELARETANFLGIRSESVSLDHLRPFDRWDQPEFAFPEPIDDPFSAGVFDQSRAVARACRVALEGEGSDNLMHFEMLPYAQDLLRRKEWLKLFSDVSRYLWRHPPVWPRLWRRALFPRNTNTESSEFPAWLDSELVTRLHLVERWKRVEQPDFPQGHPAISAAHASLSMPYWTRIFEDESPGVTRSLVEVRRPFLDLRVVNFLLAVPPFPWLLGKKILREAMAGRLPDRIRFRPKTPMSYDPLELHLRKQEHNVVDWAPPMDRYVNHAEFQRLASLAREERANPMIRPTCLNLWLRYSARLRYKLSAETSNG